MLEDLMSRVVIPQGALFSDLQLSRGPDGLRLDWSALERICEASNIDAQSVRSDPEKTSELVAVWYARHRAAGGDPDPVMEDFATEARVEAEREDADVLHRPPYRPQ